MCVLARSGEAGRGMAVELCCDETRFGEAVQVRSVKAWSGLSSSGWARRSGHVMVGRGSVRRSNYNSH